MSHPHVSEPLILGQFLTTHVAGEHLQARVMAHQVMQDHFPPPAGVPTDLALTPSRVTGHYWQLFPLLISSSSHLNCVMMAGV